MNRPYRFRIGMIMYHNDSMEMIRHDNGGINGDAGVADRKEFPNFPNNCAKRIALHFTVIDLAKERFANLGAKRHKIQTGVGIIGFRMAE